METVSAKVPDDVQEKIEDYREGRGLTRSHAIRRLINAGYEAEQRGDGIHLNYPAAVMLLGWWLVSIAFVEAQTDAIGPLGIALIVGPILWELYRRLTA